MKLPKVLIGLPTMGNLHILLAANIMAWLVQSIQNRDKGVSIYPTVGICPVDNARNEIVNAFLESDCTHLFFIDSDTIPPQDALDRLLKLDTDIAVAPVPIIEVDEKTGRPYRKWNCVGMDDKHIQPNAGIIQIKGAGTACMLIKRQVFERMDKPYFRFQYQDDNGKSVVVSEDIYFTVKALSLGYKTLADTSILCKHAKQIIM